MDWPLPLFHGSIQKAIDLSLQPLRHAAASKKDGHFWNVRSGAVPFASKADLLAGSLCQATFPLLDGHPEDI